MKGGNTSLRIDFLVDEYPRLGGAEAVTDRLAEELSQRGFEVRVICRIKGSKDIQEHGYKTFTWSPLGYALKRSAVQGLPKYLKPFGALLIILRKAKILPIVVKASEKFYAHRIVCRWESGDLVISTRADSLDQILTAAKASPSSLKDVTVINQFHTSLDPMGEYGAFIDEARKSQHVINGFTVLSERCRTALYDLMGRKTPVLVLPNPNPRLKDAPIRKFSKKIIVAGRLVKSKQVDLAIEAFENFIKDPRFSDWSLDIFGDGEMKSGLEKIIQHKGLHEKVALMGQAESPSEIFSTVGVHLLASRFEGWSLVVQEAGYFGVASAAFDVSGGTRNLVLSLGGRLAKPGNLEELVANLKDLAIHAESDERAEAIQQATRQFDVEKVADSLLDWVAEIRQATV